MGLCRGVRRVQAVLHNLVQSWRARRCARGESTERRRGCDLPAWSVDQSVLRVCGRRHRQPTPAESRARAGRGRRGLGQGVLAQGRGDSESWENAEEQLRIRGWAERPGLALELLRRYLAGFITRKHGRAPFKPGLVRDAIVHSRGTFEWITRAWIVLERGCCISA